MTRNPPSIVKPGEEPLWGIAVQAAETQYAKKDVRDFTPKDWARTIGLFKSIRSQKRKNPGSRYEIRHIHGEGKDWDQVLYFIHDWEDPHHREKEDVVFYTSRAGAVNALKILQADEDARPFKKNPDQDDTNDELMADEEDIFFSPSGPLGSRTSVSAGGKFLGEFKSDEEAEEAAKKWCKKNNFYPSAWQVSDHGNYHLISGFWKEGNPNRESLLEASLKDGGKIVLWKSVETTYHPSSKTSKIRGKASYSVVVYDANGEAQEGDSEFGIKTLSEANAKFKALKNAGKEFVFTSGIRKITITATSLDAAKLKLTQIEPDAWNDPSWNWKVETRTRNPHQEDEPERVLLLDESRGIHIPKKFAQNFDMKKWHVDKEDEQILLSGPDGEHYWEAWDDVLAHAYIVERGKKWTLEQDGDLFAVHYKE